MHWYLYIASTHKLTLHDGITTHPYHRIDHMCTSPLSKHALHLSIFPIPHPLDHPTPPPSNPIYQPPPHHSPPPPPHPHQTYITTPTATPKNKKTNIKISSEEDVLQAQVAARPDEFRRIYMAVSGKEQMNGA